MFGSYDFYRTQLDENWEVVPGRVALGLDAAYQNNESFIDFVETVRCFIAPAFNWQIDENTTLIFAAEIWMTIIPLRLRCPTRTGR